MLYRVTASALNLRIEPRASADRVDVMLRDALVNSLDDPQPTAGWLRVAWHGGAAYAAAQYLTPADPAASNNGGVPLFSPQTSTIPAAPPVEARDRDPSKLHPAVRGAILNVVEETNKLGLPFRIFEAYRTPERQNWLYAQGRTQPGQKVTDAKAWQSMHQYGLAADIVLFVDGEWSWGGKDADWTTMHDIARDNGLTPLKSEKPHIELIGADWRHYQQGLFPSGGDESWFDAISLAAARWARKAGEPAGQPLTLTERPPLEVQAPSGSNAS